MAYTSISIQGNIISGEVLEKIRSEENGFFQRKEDFGFDQSVREEINMAWAESKAHWEAFKIRRERISENDTGTAETRSGWMIPFFGVLGYELEYQRKAVEINNRTYHISHKTINRDGFPIYIAGINQTLDKRAEIGGVRLSPHALVQEYLNNHDNLYALVTNGKFLRLLRDATRLSRLSYLEFDLERIFEDNLFDEFALLFRVLHVSRMPEKEDEGEASKIEHYHQESIASGSRIREKLSEAVETAIVRLGNGFFAHPQNEELRRKVNSGGLKPEGYYLHLLRLVYRILFLMVIEERKLVYPDERDEKLARLHKLYFRFYSLKHLRDLALQSLYVEAGAHDLWQGLKLTFGFFEKEKNGAPMGIKPLGSGLFDTHAMGELSGCMLGNQVLLDVLKTLTTFENEQKQLVKVNYGDLDVEEFGSVYEGLLEYDAVITEIAGRPVFNFEKGEGRSSSGSHYTPEELVKPLIQHSLDYIIADKLKEKNPEEALLSITVCDVACGSGHILLSAARRIAFELARVRTGEDQPTPPAIRKATRDVIRHCIYGVDLNPLAVELCKVALWLEAHNPNEPLNFLDHHIKCGNAIVGLAYREELENGIADEAYKTLPGDDKDIAKAFLVRNKAERKERTTKETQLHATFEKVTENTVQEAIAEYEVFRKMPESSPEEIIAKQKAYNKFLDGKGYLFLKTMCDTQVAQFFIPKTIENKDRLITDNEFRQMMQGYKGWTGMKTAKAASVGLDKRFFHWFLEFPEVFVKGGFDCILGNPPFLGDRRLKEAYGEEFLEWIRFNFTEGATVDLVVYFFLRINSILKLKGFQSLISTNTVAQGKAREFGLEKLIANGSVLNFAVKGMKWPGLAAVEVSLITLFKGAWSGKFYLNGKETNQISAFLDESDNTGTPFPLSLNEGKSYQGSIILGMGFVLEPDEAKRFCELDSKNRDVLFPYLNGDDLNNNPNQKPSRLVINFFDWSEEKASKYSEPFNLLLEKVKPERWKKPEDEKYPFWFHWRPRKEMYSQIKLKSRILVSCRVSKYVNQSFVEVGAIFDVATSVVIRSEYWEYTFLQSSFHNHWAWKYGSTMKFDIRYTNKDCIDTFPISESLPSEIQNKLETIGEEYHEHRRQLMLDMQLGLTKTYNLFHSNAITEEIINERDKQVVSLQKHLEKTTDTISFDDAIQGIFKLRELHVQMDYTVLDAYGWNDIQLLHDFYEVDYLPENDRVRFTIHPDARKEVLKRLLLLNHERFEEEIRQGLHKKKDAVAFYQQKGKDVPADAKFSDGKGKSKAEGKSRKARPTAGGVKGSKVSEPEANYGQMEMFGEAQVVEKNEKTIQERSKVIIKNQDGKEFRFHILKIAQKDSYTDDFKDTALDSGLGKAMMGKKEGDTFRLGESVFEVVRVM